jgi:Flp pilus assembly protein TadD
MVLVVPAFGTGCAPFFARQVDGSRFSEALQLQRQGDRDRALTIYRSLDPVERHYPGVLNNMGVIYAQQGKLDLAERTLALALDLEADEATIWANLGIVQLVNGRPLAAKETLLEVEPAADRLLTRAVKPGRAHWADFEAVQRRVRRAVSTADRYLARLEQREPLSASRVAELTVFHGDL